MSRKVSVPVPLHFNSLSTAYWRGDLRGGLYGAAVALPMGLAFGVASGLGPVAGLMSAIVTGIFAALFGGTPTQVSGPTGPTAILIASVVASFAAQPAVVAGVVLLAGALQIVFGAMRLGRYIALVPYPVMSGFGAAVGCIIILMQLNPMLGQPPVGNPVAAVSNLPASIAGANLSAVVIALASVLCCALAPTGIRSIVPIHLAVLVGASIAVSLLALEVPFMERPESLVPDFEFPPLLELPWTEIWVAAIVLALISSLDSLLTSVAADTATQKFHDPDRELVGQGLGNVAAAAVGALPGSGSTFRTMANLRNGGRTPLSAVIHSGVLLVLLLAAGDLIEFIPASVLSGILIYIGFGIIDWKYIARFPYVPRGGVLIMLSVWFIALFVNVVTGAAVGLIMASLGFVKRMADMQLAAVDVSDEAREESRLSADEREALDRSDHRTLLISLAGPITFGAANRLYRRLANIAEYRSIVLDFSDVPFLDESALIALENVIRMARNNDQLVLVSALRRDIARMIVRFGLAPLLKDCPRFSSRLEALEAAAHHALED